MSKPIEELDSGARYIERYYEAANMYVYIGEKSLSISISGPKITNRTLVGLGIIESLATLLLEEGVDKEIIGSAIWENSRDKGDLADRLSRLITMEG
jgi:hypothetical protein